MALGDTRGLEPDTASDPALAAHLNMLLQRRLRKLIGPDRFGGLGQLTDWRLGLVKGLDPACVSGRVQALCPRLTRPECAMALALNSFLAWREQPSALRLIDTGGFTELHFGGRCPTGVRGTPPHVEVIASGPDGVVGAAVRVFDYLGRPRTVLSAAYRSLQVGEGMTGWVKLLHAQDAFRYVDAGGLAKIAIGLGRIFLRRPVGLLYLYLEPQETSVPAMAGHRAELDRLGDSVAGSTVGFSARSLHELWRGWCAEDTPAEVRGIAAELAHRYRVVMRN